MHPYIPHLIERLIPLLIDNATQHSLAENAAICLGRLGLIDTASVAPHLPMFAESWCRALRSVRDNEEKESAFRGMCLMIHVNPQGIVKVSF